MTSNLNIEALRYIPMFGEYSLPVKIEKGDLLITVTRVDNKMIYKRQGIGDPVEKTLLVDKGTIHISPVEPVNIPKPITHYMLIDLVPDIVVGPKSEKRVYLTFPVEIGVFIGRKKEIKNIDVFSLAKQKFTLYGEGKSAIISKYWICDVHTNKPTLDPLREGLMELMITNRTNEWTEVSKVNFDAYGMRPYFGKRTVGLRAHLEIKGRSLAETHFHDEPLFKGMKKGLELYTPMDIYKLTKIHVTTSKYIMEGDL